MIKVATIKLDVPLRLDAILIIQIFHTKLIAQTVDNSNISCVLKHLIQVYIVINVIGQVGPPPPIQ